ncbi:MFS transporter [Pseudonocardia nematodicida]|uniref:MFS transporter n=1 Tax=Pseudonocardia nematodicida TaxID=1206997 RepID=A0ABV1KHD7_9PSEU
MTFPTHDDRPGATAPTTAAAPGDTRRARRRALGGGVGGYFVDQFDIYVPVIALAPAMSYFVPRDLDASTRVIVAAFIFTATLLGRPIGAVIFGLLADRTGRRRSTIIAVAGIAVTTLLIALLPGHGAVGLWAVGLLIALRFLDGVFLGGEYTAAIPLAMEWARKDRRGLASGLITMTSPLALCVISLLTLGLLQIAPAGAPDSAYSTWGWRVPFVVGALLAVAMLVYFVRYVPESEGRAEQAAAQHVSPLRELFAGAHRRSLLQVFVLMTGIWTVLNVTVSVLPGLTSSAAGFSATQVTVVLAVGSLISAVTYPLAGMLSQVIGRRWFYVATGVLVVVASGGTVAVIGTATGLGGGSAAVLLCVAFVVGFIAFGPIAAYLTERFPGPMRASGYGIGYSLALVLPAFFAYYLLWLASLVGTALAPAALVVIGGVLIAVGALLGPETRDADMTAA